MSIKENKLAKYDERTCWLAATVFTDVHHGSAITERESQYRDELARAFSDEVTEARTLVAENQEFENMDYADKIIYCINLIDRLWEEKHGDEEVIIQLPPEEEVNYADINDLLDSIPQEETSVVFEDEGHRVK